MTTGWTRLCGFLASATLALSLGPPTAAQEVVDPTDDGPSAEERAQIVQTLIAEGYIRWGAIERVEDERVWRVEGAMDADERNYVVDVDESFAVARRERD
jgi:hypothetical protein